MALAAVVLIFGALAANVLLATLYGGLVSLAFDVSFFKAFVVAFLVLAVRGWFTRQPSGSDNQ